MRKIISWKPHTEFFEVRQQQKYIKQNKEKKRRKKETQSKII